MYILPTTYALAFCVGVGLGSFGGRCEWGRECARFGCFVVFAFLSCCFVDLPLPQFLEPLPAHAHPLQPYPCPSIAYTYVAYVGRGGLCGGSAQAGVLGASAAMAALTWVSRMFLVLCSAAALGWPWAPHHAPGPRPRPAPGPIHVQAHPLGTVRPLLPPSSP
jgi:hypothetical protein